MQERSRLRIDETLGEAIALHGEVDAWRSGWDTVDAIGGHLTHLDLLAEVLLGLVDEIARRTAAIDPASGTGAVYEEVPALRSAPAARAAALALVRR